MLSRKTKDPARRFYSSLSMAVLLLSLLLLSSVDIAPAAEVDADALAALGKRIYQEGILSDGTPMSRVVARAQPDGNVACVRCHRLSGLGGMEGGELVPAVTGDYLFRNHLKVVTEPTRRRIKRWAYNEAAFDRVLRQGIDVMGDPISLAMPRYALSDEDRKALMAYLKTLVHEAKPGIEPETVHIATVLDSRLPLAEREALIEVARRYVETENRVIQARERRAAFSDRQNNWNVKSFRRWRWHLWELEGEPSSWPGQLQAYYEQQPVFMLVGGAVEGPWQPVDDFCEGRGLPCLFPHTDLPATGERSHFTFYLSRGLALEADVLGTYLRRRAPGIKRVIQVHSATADGRYAAQALNEALMARGLEVDSRSLSLDAESFGWLDQLEAADAVMLWLDEEALKALAAARDKPPANGRFFLSSSLLDQGLKRTATPWDQRIEVVHPFSLPWENSAGLSRGFLHKWGLLDEANFRLQSETFAAFAAAGQVIMRIRQNLVREYLMEQLEHMSESLRSTSVYPRFSLGPYQRVVSKGAYIFPLSDLESEDRGSAYRWLIPSL